MTIMVRMKYPILYQCRRCPATYTNLLKARCHVYLEHGVSWRRARLEIKKGGVG